MCARAEFHGTNTITRQLPELRVMMNFLEQLFHRLVGTVCERDPSIPLQPREPSNPARCRHGEERAAHATQHPFGGAAAQRLEHTRAARGRHHDELGPHEIRGREDLRAGIAVTARARKRPSCPVFAGMRGISASAPT